MSIEGSAFTPPSTLQGQNDWHRLGYGGHCLPSAPIDFHKLYALDTVLHGLGLPTKAKLEQAMAGHILAQAELVGTYRKAK